MFNTSIIYKYLLPSHICSHLKNVFLLAKVSDYGDELVPYTPYNKPYIY